MRSEDKNSIEVCVIVANYYSNQPIMYAVTLLHEDITVQMHIWIFSHSNDFGSFINGEGGGMHSILRYRNTFQK